MVRLFYRDDLDVENKGAVWRDDAEVLRAIAECGRDDKSQLAASGVAPKVDDLSSHGFLHKEEHDALVAKYTHPIIKKYGDDYTFDVEIENKGGQTEYYTLYNLPQWLTVVGSSASDDLAPLKTLT